MCSLFIPSFFNPEKAKLVNDGLFVEIQDLFVENFATFANMK
jgi:hypothetical protein